MSEVRLDQVLERLPSGLPLPVGCWLVGRVASAIAAQPRPVTPLEVRIREDGGVRVAEPGRDTLPFAYRAPEVIRGAPESARSAVFTLGVLLVETITGRSPFARGTDLETRIAVAEEEVPPLTGRVGQASSRLDAVVAAALAKGPEGRPSSTVELAERLDAFLDEELFDVGPEELVTAVRAAFAGVDLWTAMRDPGSVVAPLPTGPSPARRPQPPPPQPSPASGGGGNAIRQQPPPPQPSPAGGGGGDAIRPQPSARGGGGDAPEALEAELPMPDLSAFEDAELDLRPQGRRTSAPAKPRLDEKVVRLGDPLQEAGAAGITEAAVTGLDRRDPTPRPHRTAGMLDIDRDALARERNRPATLVDAQPEPEPGPNWVKRIAIALVVLLAAAIAYQFAIRPLLKG